MDMTRFPLQRALVCLAPLLLWAVAAGAQPPEDPRMDDERIAQFRRVIEARVVYTVPGMDAVDVRRDLAYKTVDDAPLGMDVYLPAGLAPDERRGAVLFVHGGPAPPSGLPAGIPKPKSWGLFESYGELVAASGLVGVTFNHRYASLAALGESAADVAAAIDYVRSHAGELHVDADRLALWVFSGAGPHLSVVLRERPASVRCLVSFYSVLDFAAFAAMGMGEAPPEVVERYSPRAHLHDAAPPFLLARAGRDHPATNQAIDAFLAAALEHGVAVDFLSHPQGRHGFDVLDDDARSRAIVRHALEFLTVSLRP